MLLSGVLGPKHVTHLRFLLLVGLRAIVTRYVKVFNLAFATELTPMIHILTDNLQSSFFHSYIFQ